MTEAPQAPQAPAEGAPQASQGAPQAPEGFVPQETVNKVVGERAKEAEQRAVNRVLERAQQYGVESLDDVFSRLEAYHAVEQETETAADRAEKARVKAEEKATAAEQRYTNTLREYALRDALRDSGINPERLKGAMRLADMSALEVDSEGNVTGLETVVEAVREDSPEWFGEQRARVNAPQTNGTGIRTPANTTDPQQQHAAFLAGLLNGP